MSDWIITVLIAAIAAAPGWYAAFIRAPRTDQAAILKTRAEAEKVNEEAETLRLDRADRLAKQIEIMELRLQQLECENNILLNEVETLKNINAKLIRENGDLREWAERLIEQVKSADIEPVILDRRKHST